MVENSCFDFRDLVLFAVWGEAHVVSLFLFSMTFCGGLLLVLILVVVSRVAQSLINFGFVFGEVLSFFSLNVVIWASFGERGSIRLRDEQKHALFLPISFLEFLNIINVYNF